MNESRFRSKLRECSRKGKVFGGAVTLSAEDWNVEEAVKDDQELLREIQVA